jgi:hypothetical protein
MIVSLYDYNYYMTNAEPLLTYENNGLDFSDIHSYWQGSYISSGFSEKKPDLNDWQQYL